MARTVADRQKTDHRRRRPGHPDRRRRTYATRLRHGGADPAQIQALLGHGALESTARYFNPRELHQTGENPQVAC